MKKVFLIFSLFITTISFTQTRSTGDKELDNVLVEVNTNAQLNLSGFKLNVSKTYNTPIEKVEKCFKVGMTAGDVIFAFELSTISRKPIELITTSFTKNKGKGWGVIAKEMGIKPGSPEFHRLKQSTKGHKDKVKQSKGNSNGKGNSGTKTTGNGNSKGKGNSNGKGNGKK